MSGNEKGLTLSQFQAILAGVVHQNPNLQRAWVKAELSDVRVVGGHCYMELIEKDEVSGQMRAKMRAMIWAGTFMGLRHRFLGSTGNDIRAGLKVLVCGSATYHSVYGLSFNIVDIDPSYTLGDLERQRREILDRLAREGKINLNKGREFPVAPQRIAVISSAGAAGYGDFMNHLTNSPEGFRFYTLLVGAVMQGERTSESVISALDFVESTCDSWDCVVIIRGGGATTDLNGFDTYELAERVASFALPVVVGIGHERDRTVLDEVACVRCKTPTAVADFLVSRCRQAWVETDNMARRIAQYTADRLAGENLRLANIENILPARISAGVTAGERRIDRMAHSVENLLQRSLSTAGNRLDMDRLRLENALRGIVEKPALRLRNLENMLRVLSPENTMRRGYSITRIGGRAIYDASELKPGDVIETTLLKGRVISKIGEIDQE